MAVEEYAAVPANLITRCTKFVQRVLQQKDDATVSAVRVVAYVRGVGEQQLAVIPVSPDVDPGELAQELAHTVHDCDDAERAILHGMAHGESVASIVLQIAAARKDGKGKARESMLGTDARDVLLTTAISAHRDMSRMMIADRETLVQGLLEQNKSAQDEIKQLRADARTTDEMHRRLVREDREQAATLRVAEAQAKAIEQLGTQVVTLMPSLTRAIGLWATGKAGLPPEAAELLKIAPALLDVVRELDGDQIQLMAGMLDGKGKAALVRAWELAQKAGPKKLEADTSEKTEGKG